MMASGKLDLKPLISHRFLIDQAAEAYQRLDEQGTLGMLIDYPDSAEPLAKKTVTLARQTDIQPEEVVCTFIGGGNYASRVLIPAFTKAGV